MPDEDICDVPMADEDIDVIGLLLLLLEVVVGGGGGVWLLVDVVGMLLVLNGEDEVAVVGGVDTR